MIDGPGGNGKTFLLETIVAYCNSRDNQGKELLALASAFSGVAVQLLPNGLTIHKRFRINPHSLPTDPCKILGNSAAGALLKKAAVLILDEVSMMNKVDLERIDRSMKILMNNDKPFGGKIMILSGDFRQILPVEPNVEDSLNTNIKQSTLFLDGTIQPRYLTINERVRQFGGHPTYA